MNIIPINYFWGRTLPVSQGAFYEGAKIADQLEE
jgi:hypothetical protein